MTRLLFIGFILIAIQGLLTSFQIINYKSTLKKFKNKGTIGIGIQKGKIKSGKIVILVSNESGEIITGEQMKGMTIFARFKAIKGIEGKDIFKLREEISKEEKKKQDTALINAIDNIEKSLAKSTN